MTFKVYFMHKFGIRDGYNNDDKKILLTNNRVPNHKK